MMKELWIKIVQANGRRVQNDSLHQIQAAHVALLKNQSIKMEAKAPYTNM